MLIYLALALIIAVLTSIFAIQNAEPVRVVFLTWEFNSSRALVLLMTFALGATVGLLACVPMVVKGRLKLNELERKARSAPQSGPGTKPAEPETTADRPGGPDAGHD